MFCASQLVFSVKRISLKKTSHHQKIAVLPFPNCPLSEYYMTSWTFWGANIDFGLGKSWQQKLLRKELGRAGSREFGRAGSRELGRAGSRELGRAGSKEAGTAEALDFCGENLRFSTWLPQVSSGDLGEFCCLVCVEHFPNDPVMFSSFKISITVKPNRVFFFPSKSPARREATAPLYLPRSRRLHSLGNHLQVCQVPGLKMAVLPPAEVNQRHSSHKIPWDWSVYVYLHEWLNFMINVGKYTTDGWKRRCTSEKNLKIKSTHRFGLRSPA